jgi:nucleoside-diphosphate-sugar epimerase
VTAITRDASKAAALERQGVHAVACDVFDTDALIEAVRHAAPDAVIHQLTDLPAAMDPRNIDDLYARNDRVRREGTRNLLEAASLASVPRFVLQSMGTWYRPEGASVKAEQDPLWTDAPEPIGAAVRTVADMETRVTQGVADAVVLRSGAFYGPGNWYARDSAIVQMMRRRLPRLQK